jgi:glutathione S-transferase
MQPIPFKGAPGSPYTRKMLALMRYRHIPYRYLVGTHADALGFPKPAVELLPTFYLPNADGDIQAVTDSTPLIRRLEKDISERSVIPKDPALAFLDALLEDFADEWVTKAMFHYRWSFAPDIEKAGGTLPAHFVGITAPEEQLQALKVQFSQRQISRLPVVGSNPTTAKLIESAYTRLVQLLDEHFCEFPFLLGSRPATCDFAMYGQLSQLVLVEPTAMALTLRLSPRVVAWVGWMEDLSGWESTHEQDPQTDAWVSVEFLPPSLMNLLSELSMGYVPLMIANAKALSNQSKQVEVQLNEGLWTQATVPYQGKCLRWLREQFSSLNSAEQLRCREVLETTGCISLIEEVI